VGTMWETSGDLLWDKWRDVGVMWKTSGARGGSCVQYLDNNGPFVQVPTLGFPTPRICYPQASKPTRGRERDKKKKRAIFLSQLVFSSK